MNNNNNNNSNNNNNIRTEKYIPNHVFKPNFACVLANFSFSLSKLIFSNALLA